MKRKTVALFAALAILLSLALTACSPAADKEDDPSDPIQHPTDDKDFSELTSASKQEKAYEYETYFLPAIVDGQQPYVGDTMPFYDDGTYYIYYLKDGADSYNHSVFLTTTKDFVTYEEHEGVVLEANRTGGQDSWVGTGSVCKVGDKYYFFYTGHTDSSILEFKETVMVAEGTDPTSFTKVEGWEITPPAELGQKQDFRDPQAYYDPDTGDITLTITAAKDGVARILKYTLSSDLQNSTYDGIIFTNDEAKNGDFWNLECSDTFKLGDKYYITYSAQDDTLWYAVSDTPYGPYGDPVRLDGKLFYAAKHVESENGSWMVGWARRSSSVTSTRDVDAWGGNIVAQKLCQNPDGTLYLEPVEAVSDGFNVRRDLVSEGASVTLKGKAGSFTYKPTFTCYESYKLTGTFKFEGEGVFGLSFDYNGEQEKNKFVAVDTQSDVLRLGFNEDKTMITETSAPLEAGQEYTFTYIQEGSVGVFYIDGVAALTVRLYGASGKPVSLVAEGCTVEFTHLREYTR